MAERRFRMCIKVAVSLKRSHTARSTVTASSLFDTRRTMSLHAISRLLAVVSLFVLMTSLVVPEVDARHVSVGVDDIWTSYKKTHGKLYANNMEEAYRRSVWQDNVDYIQKHNLEADLGLHSYTLGLNRFADLTVTEYRKLMLGAKMPAKLNATKLSAVKFPDVDAPDTVDWRTQGYVTPVKDQGQCGSCWAFSTTGTLEGQHFKQTGNLVSLSEKNLMDCSAKQGNQGCDGGLPSQALDYVIANGGIDTEASYPYVPQTADCQYDPAHIGATCTGYQSPTAGDEDALKQAVASVGPISVAIDASHQTFQLYKSGVYDEPECSPTQLDHAVLVVGYGSLSGKDYWLVKNSWATVWGKEGYILMSRNKDNQCGIASQAVYPTGVGH